MLDLGWAELAVIAIIAIIVIGPRELPRAFKTMGYWSGKARRVMRDFQNSINDMAEESELNEVRKQIESASSVNMGKRLEKSIDPDGSLAATTRSLSGRSSSLAAAPSAGATPAVGAATPAAGAAAAGTLGKASPANGQAAVAGNGQTPPAPGGGQTAPGSGESRAAQSSRPQAGG
ncbi:MAG: Sec-independent protein translocase protein TatB [Alphaproteobacteria bacterium]